MTITEPSNKKDKMCLLVHFYSLYGYGDTEEECILDAVSRMKEDAMSLVEETEFDDVAQEALDEREE